MAGVGNGPPVLLAPPLLVCRITGKVPVGETLAQAGY